VSVVQALYETTKALHELVSKGLPEEDRESYIEQLKQLLDERQSLMTELSGTYSEGDMKVGQELVALNQQLEPLLKEQLMTIETDIGNIKRKKAGSNRYNKGYQNFSSDGMFLDKKK
jgi:flagellar protein FliT